MSCLMGCLMGAAWTFFSRLCIHNAITRPSPAHPGRGSFWGRALAGSFWPARPLLLGLTRSDWRPRPGPGRPGPLTRSCLARPAWPRLGSPTLQTINQRKAFPNHQCRRPFFVVEHRNQNVCDMKAGVSRREKYCNPFHVVDGCPPSTPNLNVVEGNAWPRLLMFPVKPAQHLSPTLKFGVAGVTGQSLADASRVQFFFPSCPPACVSNRLPPVQ